MSYPLHEPRESMAFEFCRNEAYLRQEFSRIGTPASHHGGQAPANRLEALLARQLPGAEDLDVARKSTAAAAAHLPIAPEMAWALPQLLKRIQLVAPGALSTSAVLRSLVRTPERDEQFAIAFADSGFLSCDRAIGKACWKYDFKEMIARQEGRSTWDMLEHCRVLLAQHRMKQPIDWEAVLLELQTLMSWFPELRTLRLLEQLYTRLHVLHMKSVLVVQCWLDWRANLADCTADGGQQGAHHA